MHKRILGLVIGLVLQTGTVFAAWPEIEPLHRVNTYSIMAYEQMNRGDELIAEGKFDEAGAAYARAGEVSFLGW